MRGDRGLFHEQGDRRRPADELQLIGAPQLFAERERVYRRAAIEQREHGLIDRAVRLRVEIRRAEHLDHARQRFTTLEKDGAEHGALGVQVVRRDARGNFEGTHQRIAPRTTSMRHLPRDAALGSNKFGRAELVTTPPPFRFAYRVDKWCVTSVAMWTARA